jgi:hypothetical protein
VRLHPLAPQSAFVAKALVEALMRESLCSPPFWVSWYQSEEIGGTNYGDVFDPE